MTTPWVDTTRVQDRLKDYFHSQGATIAEFGRTVNQTFEAFVFAQVVKFYQHRGWTISLKHPAGGKRPSVRLKFSTRGRPDSYTYAVCRKGPRRIQVRHGLRVATRHYRPGQPHRANIVLDVAVISDLDLSSLGTNDHVDNSELKTFGEAKHMSAFAELLASFVGVVHEMLPERLGLGPPARRRRAHRPWPFLYVSGYLYPTAQGLAETFAARRFRIHIHDQASFFHGTGRLPTRPPTRRP